MKVRVALAALAAFFCLVGGAQAFEWFLPYGQAKHATKEFAEETCRRDHKCRAYHVGPCRRQSHSRVDCAAGFLYRGTGESAQAVVCAVVLHWGVSHNGELALKRHGRPRCSLVEPEGESESGSGGESEPGVR
jgi:hypothetical protein